MIIYILSLICGVLVLGIDQLTKYYISSNFDLGFISDFIPGVIDITYIHNHTIPIHHSTPRATTTTSAEMMNP